MLDHTRFINRTVVELGVVIIVSCSLPSSTACASKVNIDGKVVLANVAKHAAHFRVANVKKEIAPHKASVLSPTRFPIAIKIWNGKRGQSAWVDQSIQSAGVYTFRYQNGEWKLSRHQKRANSQEIKPDAQTETGRRVRRSSSRRRSAARHPSYRRTTGSTSRVVGGSGRVYRGPRIPILRRVSGSLLGLYRFVRDEEDRDLIRDIIIGREIDEEIERELWDRLDDLAVNLPALERREFDRALSDLRNLGDRDLRELEDATDEDWDLVREELGDDVADNAWREIESDYGDIDTLPGEEIDTLDEVGIDSLDSDVDLGDLEGGDAAIDDLAGTLDDFNGGDLGGIEEIDLGDLGQDFGGDLGQGGEIQDSLDRLSPGFGTDLDYDSGGFDDYGDNMGGGDFGGGDYGGPEFGGGDFGGDGFDDFGGGGFDDFGGGGFDDFGGDDF